MIVSTYAALLALYYIYLSINVIKIRKSAGISLGSGNNPILERAMRAHGNFIEYVPLALLLIYLLEYQGLASHYCHAFGIVLFISRALHGDAIIHEKFKMRVIGVILTFSIIILSALLLLLGR